MLKEDLEKIITYFEHKILILGDIPNYEETKDEVLKLEEFVEKLKKSL